MHTCTFLAAILILASTPAALAQEDPIETRVYNVEFLTATVEDFPGMGLGFQTLSCGTCAGDYAAGHAGLLTAEDLIKLIRNNIAEDTWEHVQAGLEYSRGILTVTNHRSVHERIAQYLDYWRGVLGRIVVLDAAVVSIDPALLARIRSAGNPDRPAILSPQQVQRILEAAREGQLAQLHKVLRVTAHPGQRVNLQEVNQREYVKDYNVKVDNGAAALDPVTDLFATGVSVDVRPHVAPFADAVTLEVRSETAEAEEPVRSCTLRLRKEIHGVQVGGEKKENEGAPPKAEGAICASDSRHPLELPAIALEQVRTTLTVRNRETAIVGSTFRAGRQVIFFLTPTVVPVEEKAFPEPVFEEQRLLKLYDASPLTRPVADFPGPKAEEDINFPLEGPAAQVGSKEVAAMIRSRIAPDTWNNKRNFVEATERGTLIVRQKPEVHREIERFLSTILAARARMITVEAYVIGFRKAARAEWEAQVPGLAPGGCFLDKGSFDRLLEASFKGDRLRLVEVAEVTGFPQQRVHVYRGRQEMKIVDYEPVVTTGVSLHDPIVCEVDTAGFVLDVRPRFVHGDGQIAVEFRATRVDDWRLSDLEEIGPGVGPLQLAQARTLRWKSKVLCPVGKVSLVALETVGRGEEKEDWAVFVRARPNILR